MSESEMLRAAKRERDRLRSALAQNPEYQMLQQVQRVIAVYETFEGKAPEVLTAPSERVAGPKAFQTGPRPGSKSAQVVDAAVEFFNEYGERATSGEILPFITEKGIDVGGAVPSKSLSSYLSSSPRFNSVKGLGYGLVEWGEGPGPKASAPSARPIGVLGPSVRALQVDDVAEKPGQQMTIDEMLET